MAARRWYPRAGKHPCAMLARLQRPLPAPLPPCCRSHQGGAAALESYLAGVQRSPTTEDAVYRAQRLLAALNELGELGP